MIKYTQDPVPVEASKEDSIPRSKQRERIGSGFKGGAGGREGGEAANVNK